MREPGEWKYDFGVVVDELSIEIGKSEERLDVFDLPRLRPIDDCLDF